tara:strand:- start:340 stop:615 length:276 start_codon:yes stop_codon:yes gene_type:complete
MDEFIFLIIFMIVTTTAISLFLLPWLDRRNARIRLNELERELDMLTLFPPEHDAPQSEHDDHRRNLRWIRRDIDSIIRLHKIHPMDSIKPF